VVTEGKTTKTIGLQSVAIARTVIKLQTIVDKETENMYADHTVSFSTWILVK